jgi:hypothetical protein
MINILLDLGIGVKWYEITRPGAAMWPGVQQCGHICDAAWYGGLCCACHAKGGLTLLESGRCPICKLIPA